MYLVKVTFVDDSPQCQTNWIQCLIKFDNIAFLATAKKIIGKGVSRLFVSQHVFLYNGMLVCATLKQIEVHRTQLLQWQLTG